MNQRFLIIIPAEDRDRANALAKDQFDQTGGEKTFSVGLSPTGKAPITHYWCSALFYGGGPERLTALQTAFPLATVETYDGDADPSFPRRTIAALGLKQIDKLPERPAWL